MSRCNLATQGSHFEAYVLIKRSPVRCCQHRRCASDLACCHATAGVSLRARTRVTVCFVPISHVAAYAHAHAAQLRTQH
eukprot:3197175-Pleurochrysis_carterae.AAC.1